MSRERRRRTPWIRAGFASAGVHLLALLVLGTALGEKLGLTTYDPNFKRGLIGGQPRDSAMEVSIVRMTLPEPAGQGGSHAAKPAPPPKPVTPPPSDTEVAASEAAAPAAPPPDQPDDDAAGIDALYRAPFRDAAGEAYASLRARLGCAHVDLASLPLPVRALCEAAIKLNASSARVSLP